MFDDEFTWPIYIDVVDGKVTDIWYDTAYGLESLLSEDKYRVSYRNTMPKITIVIQNGKVEQVIQDVPNDEPKLLQKDVDYDVTNLDEELEAKEQPIG